MMFCGVQVVELLVGRQVLRHTLYHTLQSLKPLCFMCIRVLWFWFCGYHGNG